MSAKWWKITITTAFVGLPSAGLAACPANIADVLGQVQLDQPAQEAFNVLADCIIEQAGLIADLTKKLEKTVPATGDDLNTAAIIAFTADKGERTCPAGWQPFEPAKDRFIVGAGSKYPVFSIENAPGDSIGGADTVTLTKAQMPAHTHTYQQNYWTNIRTANTDSSNLSGGTVTYETQNPQLETGSAGLTQPHPNIPPYIALVYCQKI